ncbi:hypothetical protein ACFY36_19465 [Actinoplanes sp. NPDC000266]
MRMPVQAAVITKVRVVGLGMRAAICQSWVAVAKGPRLAGSVAQAEPGGGVEVDQMVGDGFA